MTKSEPIAPESPSLKARALKELRRFVIMFVYLWVLLGLFVLNERIILGQRGIGITMQGFAVLNALVLAKVMLIAEDLQLGAWLRPRPLIYPILGDALIFTVAFICFHILEHMAIGLYRGESVAASIPAIGGGGLAGLFTVATILFVALIPFFGYGALDRELGPGRLRAMLFGRSSNAAEVQ